MTTAPQVKPNGYTRRSVQRQRRRARWYADRERRAAGDPKMELNVAIDRLKSAAKHTGRPERDVRAVAEGIAAHVRELTTDADVTRASIDHNEAALAGASTPWGRLSVALRWLWAVVAKLPDDRREAAYTGYAQQLRDELAKLPPKPC